MSAVPDVVLTGEQQHFKINLLGDLSQRSRA